MAAPVQRLDGILLSKPATENGKRDLAPTTPEEEALASAQHPGLEKQGRTEAFAAELLNAVEVQDYNAAVMLEGNSLCWDIDVLSTLKGVIPPSTLPGLAEAAESGQPGAQTFLGRAYSVGAVGLPTSPEQAVEWYRRAAEQGYAPAQWWLGIMYAGGDGVEQDRAEALKWCRAAAEKGYAPAEFMLAAIHVKGKGLLQDKAEAFHWYRKAAEQGLGPAQCNLGVMYDEGQGVAQDKAEAFHWYRKAAEQGFATAYYNIGVMYDKGGGVAQDKAEAAKWYRKAGEQGSAAAQFSLALMYYGGVGVAEDKAEAAEWFRKAAEQGHAHAQSSLGYMHEHGESVEKDPGQAVQWYRKGAEQGSAAAQVGLGGMYDKGQGVTQDKAEAAKWYRKAAEQGSAVAQFALGFLYYGGQGVAQDKTEAARWFRKAAEQGLAEAQFNLGVSYNAGDGVMASPSAALEWYCRAAGTFLAQGKRERALACYDRMKAIEPDNLLTRKLFLDLYGEGPAGTAQQKPDDVRETATGSAWATDSGLVVTCYHVVAGTSRIVLVAPNGAQTEARVAVRDEANDLALLQPLEPSVLTRALPVASAAPRSGEAVLAVGYPHPDIMGTSPKVTSGIVNSTLGPADDPRLFQISCGLQAGNSGGPVLNMNGEVVGVAVGKLDAAEVFKWTGDLPENVGYAVKVAYLRPLLPAAGEPKVPLIERPSQANAEKVAESAQAAVLRVVVWK